MPAPLDDALLWPAGRVPELMAALAARAGLAPRAAPLEVPLPPAPDDRAAWIAAVAGHLGLEADPVEAPLASVAAALAAAGPAILEAEDGGGRFVGVLRGDDRRLALLGTDHRVSHVAPAEVAALLPGVREALASPELDRLLEAAGLRGPRVARARPALAAELFRERRAGGLWLLRPAPDGSFAALAREARLPSRIAAVVLGHVAAYALWMVSWWLLGRGVFEGRLDAGWLLGWGLVVASIVPFQIVSALASGEVSVGAGTLLKRQLLAGTLKLDPERVRALGPGQLLGRVIESEQVEALALSGGIAGLLAAIELLAAGAVVASGPGGALHAALLAAATGVALVLGRRYRLRHDDWTDARVAMTDDLTERLVGHRTRLAQTPPARRHDGEDAALERYLRLSRDLDRTGVALEALIPRAWLLLGLAALAPDLVAGDRPPAVLAVGVGGTLLGFFALRRLVDGLARLAAALDAWARVRPLWDAAARRQEDEPPRLIAPARASPEGGALLEARDLSFRYADRGAAVLDRLAFRMAAGERVRIEGPLGAGKSTLASLLSACRAPESGLLLLGGLDRRTLGGSGWRRRVVLVPPLHENHIFLGSLALNALMGRRWPARPADLAEAEAVLRALGLGPLLERMPGGLNQTIGETGWQLSDGERARVFVARGLLQEPEVLILDESFEALDPETLGTSVAAVAGRAKTIVAIGSA